MDRSEPGLRARWLDLLLGTLLALAVVVLATFAYRHIFSYFGAQDDDGYLIVSLRAFAEGGSLYDSVYSQYGPGLYTLVAGSMDLFGIPFTLDGARFVNLAFWLGSTFVAGLTLLRLTRSFPASLVGMLVVFLVLKADAAEPLHPGAAIGFVLLLTVAAAVFLMPAHPVASLAAIGACTAVLASLKVNVGAFTLAALALACVLTLPALRSRALTALGVPALVVAMPLVLMSRHLDEPNTLRLATLVASGVLALSIVSRLGPPDARIDFRAIGAAGLAALAVLVLVCAVPLLNGSSPADLVSGWLVQPARTPELQFALLFIDTDAYLWAAFGLLTGLAFAIWRLRSPALSAPARAIAGAARITVGLIFWVVLSGPVFSLSPALTQALVVVTPLAWIAVVAPQPGALASPASFVRVFITALAVLQVMHVYPVAGSQPAWAQFLFAMVGAICVADGLDELGVVGRLRAPGFRHWRALAAVPVVVFGAWFCLQPLRDFASAADTTYRAGVSVGQPGAERLRLSEAQVAQLGQVTEGLQRHCSTYISLPGLNTPYLLTGQPVPTVLSGPWPFFFDDDEQRRVLEQVEPIADLCVLEKPDVLAFWAGFSGGAVPQRPLVRFIREEFRTVADFNGYRLGVRRQASDAGQMSR